MKEIVNLKEIFNLNLQVMQNQSTIKYTQKTFKVQGAKQEILLS